MARLDIKTWQLRIGQWKRTRNLKKPIEFHLLRIMEELSEAGKELRNGHRPDEVYFGKHDKPEGFPVELGQALREILGLAEMCGIDIEKSMQIDMEYQEKRRLRKSAKRAVSSSNPPKESKK